MCRRPQTPLPNQGLEVFKPSAGGNGAGIGADPGLSGNQAKNGWEECPVPGKPCLKLVAVEKLAGQVQGADEVPPGATLRQHAMGDGAKLAGVGGGGKELMADVRQRVEETAVGVVDEEQGGATDHGWFPVHG